MRIKNLEFGIIKGLVNKPTYSGFSFVREGCDCWVLTLGFFYITWLRGECKPEVKQKTSPAMLGLAAQLERAMYQPPTEADPIIGILGTKERSKELYESKSEQRRLAILKQSRRKKKKKARKVKRSKK